MLRVLYEYHIHHLTNNCHLLTYNSEPVIQLSPNQNVNSIKIHGCLSDGSYYKATNIMSPCDGSIVTGRPLIGQKSFKDEKTCDMKQGVFWVKGKVGDNYLVSRGEGFDVWNTYTNF